MHHEHVVKSPETQESEPEEWSGEMILLYFSISQSLVNGVFNSLPRNGSPTNSVTYSAAGWALGIPEFLIVWIFTRQFKILNFSPNLEEKLNLPPDKFLFVEKAAINFCFEGNTALRTG